MASLAHALLLVIAATPDAGTSHGDAASPPWAPRARALDTLEGSYSLRKWGQGYLYEDAKFEARVAPDGTVSFKDKHAGAKTFTPFSWIGKTRAQQRQERLERLDRDPFPYRHTPWIAPPEPRPFVRNIPQEEICPPESSCYALPTQMAFEVRGRFDLTDELMRSLGKDPNALDKARFLSATFEFRIEIAIEHGKRLMKKALDDLLGYLNDLWADERYSPRERRRLLYELWYEVDRTPEGERAAKTIEAFIRRRLPCDSVDGYTRGELDGFRKSHPDRRFAPGESCDKQPEP